MKLSELINKIGDESLRVQFLHESSPAITEGKRDTRVTFSTGPECIKPVDLISNNPGSIGMIVWIPYDKYKAAISGK